jgi:hypothetical protein
MIEEWHRITGPVFGPSRELACSALPSTVPDAAGSPWGGDDGAEQEVPPSMQPPILGVIDGGAEVQIEGRDVLERIGRYLSEALPQVAYDDPFRPALHALACAAGCRQRAMQARLEAL